MSPSFEESLSTIESYNPWYDSVADLAWSYSYLVVNSTGTYVVSDAYYENNTFASTWQVNVDDDWQDLKTYGLGAPADRYGAWEDAINHIWNAFHVETATETTTSDSFK